MTDAFWRQHVQLYDPWRGADEFVFCQDVAERVCKFFPEHFRHGKGEFSDKPFILGDWQKRIAGHLFGWKRQDGTRRYREVFIYVPKKNGKTQFAAGVALILLVADNEPGAEVYSASGDVDQAKIIFEAGTYMVENDKLLDDNIKVFPGYHAMKFAATQSYWKVLSSEAKTKHGPNIHGLILDELHIFPNNELIDTLRRGTISRRQPLTIYLTTADYARPSPCNTLLNYARKVRDGIIDDKFFLPVIYEADEEGDAWDSEDTWRKVNPNYGISVKRDYFVAEVKKAKEEPSNENSFKRLHLNMQTKQENKWMNMEDWDKSGIVLEKDDLLGKKCFGALDLASTADIAAFVLYFPEFFACLCWFWVPENTAKKRIEYELWQKQGYIKICSEKTINQDVIREEIKQIAKIYKISGIAYDPWNAAQISRKLADEDGFEMFEFRQGFKSMNEPSKELEKIVIQRKLVHFGNPVLRWMAANAQIQEDKTGSIKPVKPGKDSPLKIDGIVSLVMGVGLSIAHSLDNQGSIYEERGLIIL